MPESSGDTSATLSVALQVRRSSVFPTVGFRTSGPLRGFVAATRSAHVRTREAAARKCSAWTRARAKSAGKGKSSVATEQGIWSSHSSGMEYTAGAVTAKGSASGSKRSSNARKNRKGKKGLIDFKIACFSSFSNGFPAQRVASQICAETESRCRARRTPCQVYLHHFAFNQDQSCFVAYACERIIAYSEAIAC